MDIGAFERLKIGALSMRHSCPTAVVLKSLEAVTLKFVDHVVQKERMFHWHAAFINPVVNFSNPLCYKERFELLILVLTKDSM